MQEAAKGLKHVFSSLPDPGAKERFISRGWVEILLRFTLFIYLLLLRYS